MESTLSHERRLRDEFCVVCGDRDVVLHHVLGGSVKEAGIDKGGAMKTSDWLQLPLCCLHHTGDHGIHTLGVKSWEARYGTQMNFIRRLSDRYGLDLLRLAGVPYVAGEN